MLGPKPRNWMLRPLFYFTVFCIIVFACCRSPYWEQTQIVIFHTISVGPHKPFPILTFCFCIAQKEPWELPFKFPQKVLAESRDLKWWGGIKCLDRLDCLSVCFEEDWSEYSWGITFRVGYWIIKWLKWKLPSLHFLYLWNRHDGENSKW